MRTHIRRIHHQFTGKINNLFSNGVINGINNNRARTCRAFLALEPKGRAHDPLRGSGQLRRFINNRRVLAPHFEDRTFEPLLTGLYALRPVHKFACQLPANP